MLQIWPPFDYSVDTDECLVGLVINKYRFEYNYHGAKRTPAPSYMHLSCECFNKKTLHT